MSQIARSYDIHGVGLVVRADGAELAAVADRLLGCFSPLESGGGDFELRLRYGQPDLFQPQAKRMRQFWAGTLAGGLEMIYHCAPGRRLVDLPGRCRMHLDLATRSAEAAVAPGGEWALAEGCLVPMLTEVMCLFGQHVVHAACLAAGPQDGSPGVLIAGQSGRGKTTTALALSRGGMQMLTDDGTFAVDRGDGAPLAAWGLPTPCKVLDRTLELLGWLNDLPRGPGRQAGEHALDVAPTQAAKRVVVPAVMLLLDAPNGDSHRIVPLDKVPAVEAMTSENVRAFEQSSSSGSARAFRVLARLVGQCRTYRLSAGPRLKELPELVAELLACGGG